MGLEFSCDVVSPKVFNVDWGESPWQCNENIFTKEPSKKSEEKCLFNSHIF